MPLAMNQSIENGVYHGYVMIDHAQCNRSVLCLLYIASPTH